MAGIESFTPPHGADKRLDSLTELTVPKRTVQAENEGVDLNKNSPRFDGINTTNNKLLEDKSNKGGDNNNAA